MIAIAHTFFYCGALAAIHEIPGNDSVEALAIIEANITTQDGYEHWVSFTPNPRKGHEQIMGHELGHVIGIGHPCGDAASGPCDDVTGEAFDAGEGPRRRPWGAAEQRRPGRGAFPVSRAR